MAMSPEPNPTMSGKKKKLSIKTLKIRLSLGHYLNIPSEVAPSEEICIFPTLLFYLKDCESSDAMRTCQACQVGEIEQTLFQYNGWVPSVKYLHALCMESIGSHMPFIMGFMYTIILCILYIL